MQDLGNIEYTQTEVVYSWLILAVTVTIALSNSLLLVAIALHGRYKLQKSRNLLLIFDIAAADFFYGAVVSIFYIINICHKGFYIGAIGCQLQGFLINVAAMNSIYAICALLLERYKIIVQAKELEYHTCLYFIGIHWLVAAAISIIPVTVDGYVRQASKVYCIQDWATGDPILLVPVIFDLTSIVLGLGLMVFTYVSINRKVKSIIAHGIKSTIAKTNNTQKSEVSEATAMEAAERKVFIRSVLIATVFLIGWSPYCIQILLLLFRIITPPPWYDIFASCMTGFNAIFNPFLVIFSDKEVKQMVLKLFHREKNP